MTIEFRCSQCNQLLRVPDTSAGKNARCPKCSALMQVPSGGGFGAEAPPPPPGPTGAGGLPSFGAPPPPPPAGSDPFSFLAGGGSAPAGGPGVPPPPASPFGAGASAPLGGPLPGVNPYASPMGMAPQAKPSLLEGLPINPQQIGLEPIFNFAWQIWKVNLGLLVGVTVIIMAASYAVSLVFSGIQFGLIQNDQPEAAQFVNIIGSLVSQIVQIFLGIGQVQIALKLARGQGANFSDLFNGGSLFLPVLAVSILSGIMYFVGFLALIVPGIILALMFWPNYYLVVDQKAGIIESFSVAMRVTQGNWGTAFVLGLLSFCIVVLGCMALCIGVLFAAPLVTMIWATAYLMMSGQLPVQYGYPQR